MELPRMLQAEVLEAYPEPEFLRPWRIMVTCKLMNVATADQARGVVYRLFNQWNHPSALAASGEGLEEMLRPLGLKDIRARSLRLMSDAFHRGVPPEKCFGVGPYTLDSLAVFIDGRTDLEPEDGPLRAYVRARREALSLNLPDDFFTKD